MKGVLRSAERIRSLWKHAECIAECIIIMRRQGVRNNEGTEKIPFLYWKIQDFLLEHFYRDADYVGDIDAALPVYE